MRRTLIVALLALLVGSSLVGCGNDGSSSKGQLTVFAASSLTETFDSLKTAFEKDHPDVDVVISYGSSSTLADQIKAGAPVDVIATADKQSMDIVDRDGDLADTPTHFVDNTLVVVTPKDNPAGISSLQDLAHSDFLLCEPAAPCGMAGQQILNNAHVTAKPKSYEPDVKSVLAKIELGEADAGLVYVTDAKAAGSKVHTITIPTNLNVTNPYYQAIVKGSKHADLAKDWVSLVTSRAGQRVLHDAGFSAP